MNSVDIKEIFLQIKQEALSIYTREERLGFLEKRINEFKFLPTFFSVEAPSELLKISFLISKKNYELIQPIKFEGFKVGYRVAHNDESLFLDICLEQKKYTSIFIILCKDLLDVAGGISVEQEALKKISTRLDYWREFVKSSRQGILSKDEVIGLIGELIVLKNLIALRPSIDVFKIWNGPKRATHDFTNGPYSIEVKASIKQSNTVKISSEYQLDKKDVNEKLTLCYIDLTEINSAKPAFNLPILVDEILKVLSEEHRDSFLGMMQLVGYKSTEREHYEQFNFSLNQIVLFDVNDDFPKLSVKELNSAIRNVSYDLKLNGLDSFRIDFSEFIAKYMGV